ncbi:flavin reductase family protein [Methylobacterium gnaphalii]|uniref:Flavin reductase like domain-containing protein n=1 Tax=Methylobacterium gnaphalii TaxID=1010610 RepID=A0A512JQ12_9HYPH|nr:flavin reductase family protein [Methylobacterium gnaphalii]GEP12037.1 hypothetical protein MGN01_38820 [Methylobacterium gnaphalii]GJD71617.1 FMN reductase (NADH) RutF [Methylobacterium gnaphalii]GLS51248.1 hypothetical protein GCM10007885_41030 [Methylobacterium gnaphalii]
MSEGLGPTFSSRELRDQFGLFPTGVAIITADTREGIRLGATVSSFTSVSLEPPLISFNVANSSKAFELWSSVEEFAVNILAESQSELSTRFARAQSDKWSGISPLDGEVLRVPLVPGALAWFECARFSTIPAGDHLILLGEVKAIRRSPAKDPRPLLFFSSRYRRLDYEHPIDTPYDENLWLHGW